MFVDNKLVNKIASINSSEDLYNFIKENYNLLTVLRDNIIKKLHELAERSKLKYDTRIFDELYFNRPSIADINIEILQAYIISIEDSPLYDSSNTSGAIASPNRYTALCLLLYPNINLYGKDNKDAEIDFIRRMIDLYVPSDYLKESISRFMDNTSIRDIIAHSYNYSFINNIIKKSHINEDCNYLLILFRYLSDIFTKKEMAYDAVYKFHYMETVTVNFMNNVYNIEKRFESYFGTDTILYIYDIYHIMVNTNSNTEKELDLYLYNFIETVVKKNNIKMEVFRLFLLDILYITKSSIDAFHYSKNSSYIDNLVNNNYLITFSNDINQPITENMKYTKEDGFLYAVEAYKKDSKVMHDSQHKIYKAYKNYKNAEDKVDSQITKIVQQGKKLLIGDVKTEIIEGKKFSAIGLLKKALGTAAIFSFGPIKALITLVVGYALKKNTTMSERKKIILELEAELEMVDEKIEDARGDGNREAKYALMRTRTELKTALEKIKYGLEADQRSVNTAKGTISNIRGGA